LASAASAGPSADAATRGSAARRIVGVADNRLARHDELGAARTPARLVITARAVGMHINNIFAELGLPADTDGHRRGLAVLEYLQNT
jgi:hypothetical protein